MLYVLRWIALSAAAFLITQVSVAQAQTPTKFGIFYLIWHCPFAQGNPSGNPVYDVSRALSGGAWGPVGAWHWWSQPAAGYYCLANRPDILRRHAEMIRDAGIDFVYVDSTNHPDTVNAHWPNEMIMQPFQRMLEVWNTVPNAPKIVPWVLTPPGGNMIDWMLQQMARYPNLYFYHQGKPLVMISDNPSFPPDEGKLASLSAQYTVRKMWVYPTNTPLTDKWSFFRECQNTGLFKQSRGYGRCGQDISIVNGVPEQVSITTAYQKYLMSSADQPGSLSIPKFQGRTFVRQFEALFHENSTTPRNIPIATITGWNEWLAIRFCMNAQGAVTTEGCLPNQDRVFVDAYDVEYNRDIEPQAGGMGDFYYRLMIHCIREYRAGRKCDVTTVVGGAPAPAPAARHQLISAHSNKCMDVDISGARPEHALVQQYACNPNPQSNQLFRFQQVSADTFMIVAGHSGMCLDVTDFAMNDHALIQQYPCAPGQPNQTFRFVQASPGWIAIQSVQSGKCLDVAGPTTANGARLQQYTCNFGQSNQLWRFRQAF